MADPLGTLKKTAKDLKDRYAAGNKQSEQLGTELGEARKMRELGKQALTGGASAATGESTTKAPERKPAPNPKTQYGTRPGEQRIDVSEMTKPLGSMKKGGKVPKTGMYQLHAGEKVVPARAASALGNDKKAKKGSGKKPHKMVIEQMDDQSFGITHQHKPSEPMGQTPSEEKFTAANPKALTRHVRATYAPGTEMDSDQ